MTRHYILRLLNRGSDIFALAGQSLEKAVGNRENDILNRLESLAPSELAALEMIVRLHRSLAHSGEEDDHQKLQLKSLEESYGGFWVWTSFLRVLKILLEPKSALQKNNHL